MLKLLSNLRVSDRRYQQVFVATCEDYVKKRVFSSSLIMQGLSFFLHCSNIQTEGFERFYNIKIFMENQLEISDFTKCEEQISLLNYKVSNVYPYQARSTFLKMFPCCVIILFVHILKAFSVNLK